MEKQIVNLSKFNNDWFDAGNKIKRIMWFIINALFFINPLNASSKLKVFLLRKFGASIGEGVVFKPKVNIKYPWNLSIGNNCWIGENVWIDNLAQVTIKDNVCISQGAMLLCGNHNYKKTTFDLMIGPITLEDGVWLGAQSLVGPNVICRSHSVIGVKSVATKDLDPYSIYRGNPAQKVQERIIE
ncbi:WcaF family extracellular polysaccharide biosynthesis acetyltransferase [Aegicerativicinus sediminis]|uniref:WcaF family extracellular polysaccharide biosynthesis acetyltransferase n=1 Tax=Aegicerativicinus sediminis TaxID=2893202 RepID=UPI001E64EB7C|nr:WcaF family extracellular polysaccharide biosynthesis acetyltransferase [Aegicerativicinus sediminis]